MSDITQPDSPASSNGETTVDAAQVYQWLVAGIVSSSARFLPIPFVDDLIQTSCRKYVVKTVIENRDADIKLTALQPYFGDSSGCLTSCAWLLIKAPIKLLLFPFRKIIGILTAVRGVPLEIMRVYLLARTLDRYLKNGQYSHEQIRLQLDEREYAIRLKAAFDQALSKMDFHVVLAAMKDATGGFTELSSVAWAGLKNVWNQKSDTNKGLETRQEVKAEATKIQDIFSRTEIVMLFDNFDQRVDQFMVQTS